MSMIYESPDKGKTVYAREFGKSERTLVSQPDEKTQITISLSADRLAEFQYMCSQNDIEIVEVT